MATALYRAFVAVITLGYVIFFFQGVFNGARLGDLFQTAGEEITVQILTADFYLTLGLACVFISVLERKWWAGFLVFVPAIVVGGPTIGLYLLWRLPALLRVVQPSNPA